MVPSSGHHQVLQASTQGNHLLPLPPSSPMLSVSLQAGISAIRRLRKTDNNRIARATGATICHRIEEARWLLMLNLMSDDKERLQRSCTFVFLLFIPTHPTSYSHTHTNPASSLSCFPFPPARAFFAPPPRCVSLILARVLVCLRWSRLEMSFSHLLSTAR